MTHAVSQKNAPLHTSQKCVRDTKVDGFVVSVVKLSKMKLLDQRDLSLLKKLLIATSVSAQSLDHHLLLSRKQNTLLLLWLEFFVGVWILPEDPDLSDQTLPEFFQLLMLFVLHRWFDQKVASLLSLVKLFTFSLV